MKISNHHGCKSLGPDICAQGPHSHILMMGEGGTSDYLGLKF